jgi:putative ABC transport system ATP-binding protein
MWQTILYYNGVAGSDESLIRLDHVNFENLIDYPDIEIESGRITFICGSSGCGKSTLLRLLNGTVSPRRGEIFFDGRSINEFDTVSLRKEMLLVNQTVYLFDMTIKENFEEFYRYREMPVPDDEAARSFLSLCCADFPLDMSCTSMSGGERQRVYIAIYLSFLPKVLMLDEPTSALDSKTADLMMENLVSYCKENSITMIVVSHDRSLADRFADKTVVLERGE